MGARHVFCRFYGQDTRELLLIVCYLSKINYQNEGAEQSLYERQLLSYFLHLFLCHMLLQPTCYVPNRAHGMVS